MVNSLSHDFAILPSPEYAMPWDPSTGQTFYQWIAISFSLMIGTAGLPHVIQRFYVVPNSRDARWSVVWGLFFICILYWGAPAFSHDLYVRTINPNASPETQLRMARYGTVLMAVIVTVIVTVIALAKLALIGQLVAVAFSLAGCTIFPLFLLGIWWSGSNRAGAIAGLAVGGFISIIALSYFICGKLGYTLPAHDFISYWLGAWYFAIIGAPLAIITNIVISKFTKETPSEIREFLIKNVHS